ncbi:unnamed protein product [Nesidiocoris tenuis]|uniref:Uncharacterized protein n=2 Tax=Nesidiocoris tenuis TaxID=355587 RepID=A0A6H5GQY0_9HEMI|nr:Hypothetical protein domain [Nesidiocoris tenuis]CAB0006477.1 unnamed protein product [Nesidiocoris tenuis]
MKGSIQILIAYFAAWPFLSDCTPFVKCPDKPSIVSLDFQGCDTLPCKFTKGKEERFVIEFLANVAADKVKAKVKAFALGVETTYDLPASKADVCANLMDAECPLEAGEDVKYLLLFPILPSFPNVPVVVEMYFVGDDGSNIACLRLPAVVVES